MAKIEMVTPILIFVTEDFSRKKQVKLDHPQAAGNDKVSVMKMNFVKKFTTGIYPYSMMLSAFTPVVQPREGHSVKVTMSSQEWCGHVYSQMNRDGNRYQVKSYSYFEQEGDANFAIKATLLEDEVWNLIRIDPSALPVGRVEVTPGLFFTRLGHKDLKAEFANISRREEENTVYYSVAFENSERTLAIQFTKSFPHKILGWTETFVGLDGRQHRTSATLDKTLHIDYWTRNKNEFVYLRDSLNLPINH
ncbi:MAG: hypothetical protein HC859_02780 [Bacteroidia bacterium]|nr:hypothetical protein [Bacteroidia bacterium]